MVMRGVNESRNKRRKAAVQCSLLLFFLKKGQGRTGIIPGIYQHKNVRLGPGSRELQLGGCFACECDDENVALFNLYFNFYHCYFIY